VSCLRSVRELAKSVPGFAAVVSAVRPGGPRLSVSELQTIARQSLITVLAPSHASALSLPSLFLSSYPPSLSDRAGSGANARIRLILNLLP
jgi:hypothetical protein